MVKKLKTKWLIDHIYVDCVSEKKETKDMDITDLKKKIDLVFLH